MTLERVLNSKASIERIVIEDDEETIYTQLSDENARKTLSTANIKGEILLTKYIIKQFKMYNFNIDDIKKARSIKITEVLYQQENKEDTETIERYESYRPIFSLKWEEYKELGKPRFLNIKEIYILSKGKRQNKK